MKFRLLLSDSSENQLRFVLAPESPPNYVLPRSSHANEPAYNLVYMSNDSTNIVPNCPSLQLPLFLRAPLVFQMKPVPLGKEKELSGVWPALSPGNTSGYAYGAGDVDNGKFLQFSG